jgi:hypothetical protein
MSLSEVKKRLSTLQAEQIRQTEMLLTKLQQRQTQQPSVANELMLESLKYRRQKLKQEE